MAARPRDPEWFDLSIFGRRVLNHSLRRIGFLSMREGNPNLKPQRNQTEEDIATRHVGNAVFTLQVLMRRKLRPVFIELICIIGHQLPEGFREIFELMDQSYLGNDIFETILSSLAIIAELIVFMDDFGIPLPRGLYHIPFEYIYLHRVHRKLADQGGIQKFLEVAKKRYTDSGLYQETFITFLRNKRVPHAESSTLRNWPRDPGSFLMEKLHVIPPPSARLDLSMKILQNLYSRRPGVVPVRL